MSTNVEYPVALQKVSADGKYRLTVRYDEYAEHPLLMCDFPLHMDDWSRDYTAQTLHDGQKTETIRTAWKRA
jgi:hypothetical protein